MKHFAKVLIFGWISLGSPIFAAEFVVEDLGSVERQARIRGYARSPGTSEYPPRLLIGFVDGSGTWIVNLQDGSARMVEAEGFQEDYLQWPSFIGADGKVFTSCGRGGLSIYDPVVDTIKMVRPIEKARWLRGMAIGPDKAIYVSDYPTGSAAKYDPETGEVTSFGPQGGPFDTPNIYGYSVGYDGRYVYTASGKLPWYVVAYDTKEKTQKNLFQFEPADHPEVHQRGKIVYLDVKLGSPKSGQPSNLQYQLIDGRAEPVNSIPRFDDSYVPGVADPKPEVESLDRGLPIADGGAEIRFRMPGENWKVARVPVEGNDMQIARILSLKDGRLLISTGPYGNLHFFDPKTNAFERIGNPALKNVYDLLEVGDTTYFCGYPNSVFGVIGDQGGSVIGTWHESVRSKHARFIVEGADGRIYSGNHNERESTGGALGWYDPQSGKFGGMHFPNDDCEFMTTAQDGKLIVYASDFSFDPAQPEITKRNGKLIIYDTAKQEITQEISPLSDGSAGVVLETEPGFLFGFGLHDKVPMMYRVDISKAEVSKRVQLPGKAVRSIALGPDGKVYFFAKESLLRADPKTFELETLGAAEAGRMAFIGDDLYIAGTSGLRRISDIVAF